MLTGKTELYDLDKDIGEQHDLAADHPDVVTQADQAMKQDRALDPNWRAPSELGAGQRKGDSGTEQNE
jgi:acyl dehydratase